MKKSNFVAMILGVIGVLFLGLGMCMTTITEWAMFNQGIIVGIIGLVILLITVMVYRKMENKSPIKITGKNLIIGFFGIVGALGLGTGMSLTMVFGKMVTGTVVGIIGIIILLCLFPLCKGIK